MVQLAFELKFDKSNMADRLPGQNVMSTSPHGVNLDMSTKYRCYLHFIVYNIILHAV